MDDGYIKFQCKLVTSNPPLKSNILHLNSWRTKLHDLGLIGMYDNGIGYGNVSQRTTRNQFIISGTATGANRTLQAYEYALVESFNISANRLRCRGMIEASSESLSHAAIYAASPATNAVLHIHSLPLWHTCFNKLPTTAQDIPYGTPAMATALVDALDSLQEDQAQIIIMGGHKEGVIASGPDLDTTGQALIELFASLNS